METMEVILYPLIYVFRIVLEFAHQLSGNYGVAIVILSVLVAIVTYPLSIYAQNIEKHDKSLHDAMKDKLDQVKATLKGESQFKAIEKIYKDHDYHPIKSLKSISGLAFQLPFLFSSLLLLYNYPGLVGESFLFISDLSQQDAMFSVKGMSMNVLPLMMICITFYETKIKPEMTAQGKVKFYLITIVIFVLIYQLPAAIVLYWSSVNVISLARTVRRVRVMAH